jgi:hypothetical protein
VIILGLIILCVIAYFIGGQRWANTWFRDAGCPLCMLGVAFVSLGWHWSLLGLVVSVGGMTIGDHESFYWTPHAAVITLGMFLYAFVYCAWLPFIVMFIIVVGGTYLVSRFLSKFFGADVLLRGLLYATIPLWFWVAKSINIY